jgi:uncharacterized RDD family membrane protein YckC
METGNPYAAPRAEAEAAPAASQPLATRGTRFLARILDGIVEFSPVAVGGILAVVLSSEDRPRMLPLVLGYLGLLGLWVYQIVRLVQTGQTLGKKWMGIKVVRLNGQLPSLGEQFVRGLVLSLLGLISILFIFRNDRRCLHDLAGETRVVAV